jgi:hypothetical protein
VRGWPEVEDAVGRLQTTLSVTYRAPLLVKQGDGYVRKDVALASTALGNSVRAGEAAEIGIHRRSRGEVTRLAPPPELLMGRMPAADDEVVVDSLLVYRLSGSYFGEKSKRDGFIIGVGATDFLHQARREVPASAATDAEATGANRAQLVRIGDTIEIVRQLIRQIDVPLPSFGATVKLKVVGIAAQPPLGGRAQCYLTMPTLAKLSSTAGLSQIDMSVKKGVAPDALVAAHRGEMAKGLMLETTEKITSGLDKNIQSSQLGMVLATVMAFMAAAFIITTGLTTSVMERQRELAILRCIGGTKGQLAWMQVIVGALLGLLGAAAGVPLGVLVAWVLALVFRDQVPTGLVVPGYGLVLGVTARSCRGWWARRGRRGGHRRCRRYWPWRRGRRCRGHRG